VKRHSGGKTIGISADCPVILMRADHELFTVGEHEPNNGFRMNKEPLTHEQVHELLESGVVSEGVKGFQVEDLILDSLERWVGVATSGAGVAPCSSGGQSGSSQPAA
jgi:hypothetical protein